MTKDELAFAVQRELEGTGYAVTKAGASTMIDAVTAAIVGALRENEEVKLAGLGRFGVLERSARTVKVFGETKEVAASRAPKFYPAPALKRVLNG